MNQKWLSQSQNDVLKSHNKQYFSFILENTSKITKVDLFTTGNQSNIFFLKTGKTNYNIYGRYKNWTYWKVNLAVDK